MTKPITIEVPEEAVRIFENDEKRFGREMYETAVVKWFDEGRVSQGKAAELLGLSRPELFDVLWRHKVSPIQGTAEELTEELKGA
jgi:predicted HTH domain antitoxin